MRVELSKRDIHYGSLIEVNAAHGLPREYDCAMFRVEDGSGVTMQRNAAVLLGKLLELTGRREIALVSGYRSAEEQRRIWDDSLRENGREFTEKYVAAPFHSEHQTGLAIDLGLKRGHIDFIRPNFPYDGVCGEFRRRAADFGFVERYPKGKENITGIAHEPWHFRYVGVPHAEIMNAKGFTLEEYLIWIRKFSFGSSPLIFRRDSLRAEISFLEADSAEIELNEPFSVSGNNFDGFIITQITTEREHYEIRRA